MQPILDEIGFDDSEEVPVQQGVDNQVENFFNSVPDLIDENVSGGRQLEPMRRESILEPQPTDGWFGGGRVSKY